FNRIEPDTHTEVVGTGEDIPDTFYAQQCVLHKYVGIIVYEWYIVRSAGRVHGYQHQNGGVPLTGSKAQPFYLFRQHRFGYTHAVLYIQRSYVDIGTQFKIDGDSATAITGTGAGHISHARRSVDLRFYGRSYGLLYCLRIGSGKRAC